MSEDLISEIGFDGRGGLLVKPASTKFPYIYREAMEVSWEPNGAYLYGPRPRDWSIADWFRQICTAAAKQGTVLLLSEKTRWIDVPGDVRRQIEEASNTRSTPD